MLTKENFQCNRYCGQCCKKLVIRVSKGEIEKIRKLGYKDEDFLERDLAYRHKFVLKRNKKGCVFLKKNKDGKYSCRIYKNRPKTCRQYPFFGNKNKIGSCLPNKIYTSAFVSFNRTK
jgi:Fe-S-cluster containining protein